MADTTLNTTTDSLRHYHHPYHQPVQDGIGTLHGAASVHHRGATAAAGAADVKIALTHLEAVLDEGAFITQRLRNLRV
jgi:hypothetical protein